MSATESNGFASQLSCLESDTEKCFAAMSTMCTMVTTTANIEQEQINQRASGSDGNGNSVEAMLIPRRDCFAAAAERTSICTEQQQQQQQQQAASLFAAFTLSLSICFSSSCWLCSRSNSRRLYLRRPDHSLSQYQRVYVIVIRAIF